MDFERYFRQYREKTVGIEYKYETMYGKKRLIYADWAASGRLYKEIEHTMVERFGPIYGNIHSEDNHIGRYINDIYGQAKDVIRNHVNANDDYAVLTVGYGMTAALNRLHEVMCLKDLCKMNIEKPVVIITHMEHNSNYTTWLELGVDIEILSTDKEGQPSIDNLEYLLKKYRDRKYKIGSFTACSNVTGIKSNYKELARIMHKYDGVCFVDFTASAQYVDIDMNYHNQEEMLDAVFFSPHKFLGGPGSSGVLIFHKKLYKRNAPTVPGGGTILWTNPWNGRRYLDDLEKREDGGTPGILQTIKVGLTLQLKEMMNVSFIQQREKEMLKILFEELENEKEVVIYQNDIKNRIGIISFNILGLHYSLVVKILSDVYGIQSRGGCSCSGIYGHQLLKINKSFSELITNDIEEGNYHAKPGWVRISVHPIMTNDEMIYISKSIKDLVKNKEELIKNYEYCKDRNTYISKYDMEIYDGKYILSRVKSRISLNNSL